MMSENTEELNEIPENDNKSNSVEARRAARRRKILENSKLRLEKLNGRATDGVSNGGPVPREIYPDPEMESAEDIFPNSFASAKYETVNPLNSAAPNPFGQPNAFQTEDLFSLFSQVNGMMDFNQMESPPPETKLVKFLRTKLHIVVMSVMTYVLFATGNEHLVSYNVFLPLLLWELAEAFLLRSYQKVPFPLLEGFLVFALGISQAKCNFILKAFETLNKIFKDVGVFVFFFAIAHLGHTTFFASSSSTQSHAAVDNFV